ncbi:MAG TPA: glycosyltransferase family 4 protein [Pirellulales bacterium]|jgi:glycosyltransferase involved in cell wall biosynthesis|nr:glycosyltransferase family 4 protein [Pirellulales bacterium]
MVALEHPSLQLAPSDTTAAVELPRMVLHVMNSAGGGAAMSTQDLIHSLAERGIQSSVVCHAMGSESERERLRDCVAGRVLFTPLYWMNKKIRAARWKRPLIEMRQLVKTGWRMASTRAVVEAAERYQADLIHSNTIVTGEGGWTAARLKLPHVWHVRELVGPGGICRFNREGKALGERLARHASVVVANSQATGARLAELLPQGLLRVVPNGIDISRFAPRKTASRGGPRVVAMVAALSSRSKNHLLFVRAAAQLRDVDDVEFRIYGDDPSTSDPSRKDAYANAVHHAVGGLGIDQRFRWPGHIAEPADIMQGIDILVQPSEQESFGRVMVEAMAAGIPVVSVRGGGAAEIVVHEETGLLGPPNDVAAMAAALRRLLDNSALCARFGASGRARVEANYSLRACTEGMLAAYAQAMHSPVGLLTATRQSVDRP